MTRLRSAWWPGGRISERQGTPARAASAAWIAPPAASRASSSMLEKYGVSLSKKSPVRTAKNTCIGAGVGFAPVVRFLLQRGHGGADPARPFGMTGRGVLEAAR